MAGWDEETLLLATFVVEDTPDREFGHKKRPRLRISETPPSSSRVKSITWRQSGAPSPGVAINIDDNKEKMICLEICFEPSTTPCGHSFCKKCLKSAADKCGKKCPKCRQLIGNRRSCTVNTGNLGMFRG